MAEYFSWGTVYSLGGSVPTIIKVTGGGEAHAPGALVVLPVHANILLKFIH